MNIAGAVALGILAIAVIVFSFIVTLCREIGRAFQSAWYEAGLEYDAARDAIRDILTKEQNRD